MDTAFQLDDGGRANFLQLLVQSTGCSYVCLWSFLPLPSCLYSIDGFFQEAGNSTQPSSSAGNLARRLFDEYRKSLFTVDISHCSVPGLAFRTNHPCIEYKEEDLLRLATIPAQLHFYREAKIKKALFMGCRSGEIELGFSNMPPPDDARALVSALFLEDFSRQASAEPEPPLAIEQQLNPPPSSSSSLRSLSMDSPEYSSLLLNIPGSSSLIPESLKEVDDPVHRLTTSALAITIPQQLQALHPLSRFSNMGFPAPGNEHEMMTKAFLAVISSPSSSTSSSHQQQQNFPGSSHRPNQRDSAFRMYPSSLPLVAAQMKPGNRRRDSMMKRALAFFRNLNQMRARQQTQAPGLVGSRLTTSTQLHHMMSERKRREKLNESLQALKALLPPGTKKDKASVLASTREYLASLKAEIEELHRRNAALEARLPAVKEPVEDSGISPVDRNPIDVRIRQTPESTSQDRTVDLQVIVRRECSSTQLVIRILEFLRQLNNVNLISMDADTRVADAGAVTRVNLRLRIEGNDWDESAFQEAVRRLVADVANRQF